jgi:ABC-type enterochelin transport system substrate-binding protein
LQQWEEAKEQGFEQIPPELESAAKKKLAGNDSAMVSLTSGGKLSKWAAKRRKEKRKMEKESRKRNRK